jgi:hypothetical protein
MKGFIVYNHLAKLNQHGINIRCGEAQFFGSGNELRFIVGKRLSGVSLKHFIDKL